MISPASPRLARVATVAGAILAPRWRRIPPATLEMMIRALFVWLAMLLVAVANGVFREALLVPRLGATSAHAVSTVLLCVLIALLTWASIDWVAPPSARAALALGALWVALTIAFELGFGRLVAHRPWSELLADYNLLRGRIWLLVLVTTALAPYLMARVRGRF